MSIYVTPAAAGGSVMSSVSMTVTVSIFKGLIELSDILQRSGYLC